eukprot:50160_1
MSFVLFFCAILICLSESGHWPTPQPTSEWPTEWPTAWPTQWPTEIPTEWPTERPTAWPTNAPTIEKCDTEHRHRKPWNQISQHERDLYITGIKKLNELGIQQILAVQHTEPRASVQAHGTADFGAWHSYFLWEIESQIRDLGGEHKCFTMPYWDWSYEAAQTNTISDWTILNSGLGGAGIESDDWCLSPQDTILGKGLGYEPAWHCQFETENEQCCLKRAPCDSAQTNCFTFNPSVMIEALITNEVWGDAPDDVTETNFRAELERMHGQGGHATLGGSNNGVPIGHLANVGYSPDDPIFFLIHAFVDYSWNLWKDCHDYDLVSEDDITLDIHGGFLGEPDGAQLNGPSRIDDELIYDVLRETDWSYLVKNNLVLTPRDLHDMTKWHVSYEKGPFFKLAKVEQVCNPINPKWFYEIDDGTVDTEITDTKYSEFHDMAYDLIDEHMMNHDIDEKEKKAHILNKWSLMNCEYDKMTLPKHCPNTKYFDDCSDLPRNGYGDIDVTLDELLERVSTNECMQDTRKINYFGAKTMHNLRGLCRGEYDRFCDKDFLRSRNECKQSTTLSNVF